jgi:dTDP-4-dehydrorhamnose 3,5-epimerase
MVTNEYDGTDEHGFRWDDPLTAIEWPVVRPRLSPRDEAAPSLADALSALGPR